ncbi:MAG: double-strand break repair protein AddB [Xanthobacteraceae bacterium]
MALPRVFTVPASVPFVPTLLDALASGRLVEGFAAGHDPLAFADATLYLPTRRACRLVHDSFLDLLKGDAAILPRIVALGDVDEDEIAFASMAAGELAADALALPDKLDGLERRMLLTELIRKWAAQPEVRTATGAPLVANSPAAALALADDLARLMDDMVTRQVAWDRLDELVPDKYDNYWKLTLRFLKIAREAWPAMLAERRKIEPAARRDLLIAAEAKRLALKRDGPVIAAGSTGSMPATAELIATIARLPHGAVVLPGLDTDLDDGAWTMIEGREPSSDEPVAPAVGHPQFAMAGVLRRIGISRDEVEVLGTPPAHGRERLVSEALRPAAATDRWQAELADPEFAAHEDRALAALSVLEAATADEVALAIAIALREVAETPHKTAALVTPDRALARRVLAALERWHVPVDDSGGDALPATPAGTFARLAVDVALGGLAPVPLLALLKHPLIRLGADAGKHSFAIAALERAVFRGPRPRPGSAGLAGALVTLRAELGKVRRKEASNLHRSDPRLTLMDWQLDAAEELAGRLTAALRPLEELGSSTRGFADIAARHCAALGELSADASGAPEVFAGLDGEALGKAFDEIALDDTSGTFAISPSEYGELFQLAIADRTVRRPEQPGVRVRIYGPLEARLQHADRIVLGGLVEGTWPPETRPDPWLSRPMRHTLGLDLPERRISLSAHDFAQALGAPEVILSYPAKLAGAPTVVSRFVQRLAAVAGEPRWTAAKERGDTYCRWARVLDLPARVTRIDKPAPKPPRTARPTSLSVTEIEAWLRDPYTIYAKHVLRLRELDAIDLPPGAADRGTLIHGAVGDFTAAHETGLPDDPEAVLLEFSRDYFDALEDYPEASAFWRPRFRRIARWFAGWERARRPTLRKLHAEVSGSITIPVGEREFKLRARADRIEQHADGRYAILDYKTGTPPTEKQVRIGMAPQLTLEAAMLREGGFTGITKGASIAELAYVALRGVEPPGEFKPIEFKDGDAQSHADRTLGRLKELIEKFEDEAQPYRPLVLSMWKNRYGTYDHLARVKEWSVGEEEEEW